MFASDWSIQFFSSCSEWHSDGTFKCRPLLFSQVYILFSFNSLMIPCVYCLTTKIDENVYIKLFQHLMSIANQKGIVLNPTGITCDYELATTNSLRTITYMWMLLSLCAIIMEKDSRVRSYQIG